MIFCIHKINLKKCLFVFSIILPLLFVYGCGIQLNHPQTKNTNQPMGSKWDTLIDKYNHELPFHIKLPTDLDTNWILENIQISHPPVSQSRKLDQVTILYGNKKSHQAIFITEQSNKITIDGYQKEIQLDGYTALISGQKNNSQKGTDIYVWDGKLSIDTMGTGDIPLSLLEKVEVNLLRN
ncbi:hypothetical protein FY534_03600 [Alicyclobacillus sp. TC]|uniref:DUF4367 domain-containing protein n=1 Tax=Alicyclobacillus tolerans TaxID=90970 RepID=A0A1M6UYH8_9BACL|nr:MULTISPECIES: hypothetical protein [Alicyclobacillus]QRF22863.1 hypothetical protein FY534_03600 [Alicyclobacillus sp. TC]SHK74181.1 hypothetical protein SAMN05443507_12142 [Alicyclobacillus montanus]